MKNILGFSETVERPEIVVVELRDNSWDKDGAEMSELFRRLSLINVVDPLLADPVTKAKVAYCRLHGLGKRLYKYQYTDEERTKEAEGIREFHGLGDKLRHVQ